MPIPQVNDRIKEAPVVVLRAVFAGIGQLLLTADKVRARAAEQVWTPDQPAGPGPVGRSPSWPATATQATTTTTTAPAAKAAATTKPAPAAKATTKPAPAAKATTKPAPAAKPSAKASTKPAPATKPASAAKLAVPAKPAPAAKAAPPPETAPAGAPPLPGYDDLSLPSLRARLRTLDATTIKAMLEYEKAHARRDNVISMLERRLAKITTA